MNVETVRLPDIIDFDPSNLRVSLVLLSLRPTLSALPSRYIFLESRS
jgi:hypothetical protein